MPTPIDEIKRDHLPQAGRIRMGTTVEGVSKAGKAYQRPTTSDTWILTSSRVADLEALAQAYGGTVEPWNNDKTADTHRLVTDAVSLEVILHPSAMGKPTYQKWDGGTMRRNCDGRTVTGYPIAQKGKPKPEPIDMPCICNSQEDKPDECKPKTHLSLLLPQVPLGVWRLTTSSNAALRELFGSVAVLQQSQAVGLPLGELRIDKRKGSDGKLFSVPVLSSRASMVDMLEAGNARPSLSVVPPMAEITTGDDEW